MTLVNNIKANLATIASILLIMTSFAFWFGTKLTTAESNQALTNQEVEMIKQKQSEYDKTQRELMTSLNSMSRNIERVAMKLGVETK